MGACGRACEYPLHDALTDAGDAEEVVCHAEFPYARVDRCTSRARTVGGGVFRLARNPERRQIESPQAPRLACGNAPQHRMVGEIRERMPEGGELPIDDRC